MALTEEFETNGNTILNRINELANLSEQPGMLIRTYGSEAFREAALQLAAWMKAAGLDTFTDNIGNVRGRLYSDNPDAKTFVIASHFDTVVNAGKFDGPLGVLLGIELAAHFAKGKNRLPFNLEVIAFADEEGVRFHSTYLGSKVVAGTFEEELLQRKDADGLSLEQHILKSGGQPRLIKEDRIPADSWMGYYEVHIEQGPVLYEKKIPVALVTGIAGQQRAVLVFTGEGGHAGTVPMNMRADALCAAAEFVLATERHAQSCDDNLVATVGKLDLEHPASNVIPGKVSCTLDVRCGDAHRLTAAIEHIRQISSEICSRRNVNVQWELVQYTTPVTCDDELGRHLAEAITRSGYEIVKLSSGAGHDAVAIAAVAPVSMLFVRCFRGISHHPMEQVAVEDIVAAFKTSVTFISLLSKTYGV